MNIKRSIKKLFKRSSDHQSRITNLYHTNYDKRVLISYITEPFNQENHFTHQNYITSHIVAESFSALGYNVDIVNYSALKLVIDYNQYHVIFGMGENFERSFLNSDRTISRIHFITGAHQDLHNKMGLKSLTDFYSLSSIWLPGEANILPETSYFAMYNADITIILAQGYILEDCRDRYNNRLYPLNNNILGVFSDFKPKSKRTKDFLFLSGGKQLTKGLHLLLELAKIRTDLKFHVLVPRINDVLVAYYKELFDAGSNVSLSVGLAMNSDEMKKIVETCSYSIAPSYIDGLPGGTIEPMSAGLIPIVSKYCGFAQEPFIFELEDLTIQCLNTTIDQVLSLDDNAFFVYSAAVKSYATINFSKAKITQDLITILKKEL
jgi:hypothetical protein